MADQRFRVLAVATHPVQYMAPIFRRMASHSQLQLKVAYCSLRGAEASLDQEFGATVKWDVPLLDGYDWVEVPNKGIRRRLRPSLILDRFCRSASREQRLLVRHGCH